MVDRAQWQVGGSAPEVYERDLVPAVFGPWARLVVDLADLQSGDRVLDVACGTGVVTRVAAEKVGERGAVVAADLNPGMLALAGSLPAPRGATVEWRQADAGALPFADQAFDVVLCQLGLQFFADRGIALREMYRVLRPGGDVVVMVWRPIERSPGFAALAAALERHIGPDAASIMRAPFSLGDAEELSSLVAAAGFEGLDLRASTGGGALRVRGALRGQLCRRLPDRRTCRSRSSRGRRGPARRGPCEARAIRWPRRAEVPDRGASRSGAAACTARK